MRHSHDMGVVWVEVNGSTTARIFAESAGLAENLGVRSFSRVLKSNTTFSPHQFLLEVRLFNARKLLLDQTLNITESDIHLASQIRGSG